MYPYQPAYREFICAQLKKKKMVWNCPNNFIYYTTYREVFLVEDKRNSLKSFCNTWYSTWHNILAQYFRKKQQTYWEYISLWCSTRSYGNYKGKWKFCASLQNVFDQYFIFPTLLKCLFSHNWCYFEHHVGMSVYFMCARCIL